MKKRMAGSAAALLLSTMLVSTSAQADQRPVEVQVYYPSMQFVIDGAEYAPPEGQRGFIYEGSTYVPLRFISYALQKAVKWESDTYTVKVDKPTDMDEIAIHDYNANTLVRKPGSAVSPAAKSLKPQAIEVYKEKIHYVFDGNEKQTSADLPGFIYEGTLYVPMRFFAESVGKAIAWDPETYTVSAKKDEAPAPATPAKPKSEEASKTPAVPPVVGGGAKPSYDTLVDSAKSQLSTLQNGCRTRMNALLDQYLSSKDMSLMIQGLAVEAECDNSFAAITGKLRTDLTNNGYDTAVVDEFAKQYREIKETAKNDLLAKVGQ